MNIIGQIYKSNLANGDDEIQLWCLQKNTNKTFLVKIKNFISWCYLETFYTKDESIQKLIEFFKSIFPQFEFDGVVEEHFKLFYYQSSKTKLLKLFFTKFCDLKYFSSHIKKNFSKENSEYRFLIWESEKYLINNLTKFFNMVDLNFSDWVEFKNLNIEHEEGIYYIDLGNSIKKLNDQTSHISFLKKHISKHTLDSVILSKPKVCSFDIESYAENHNRFVDATNKADVMYMIQFVFQIYLEPASRTRYLLTLKNTKIDEEDIFLDPRFNRENTFVIKIDNEKDMFKNIGNILKKEDPDIFIGYNTHIFDYSYIITRQSLLLDNKYWNPYFSKFSYITNNIVETKERRWSSSAYKDIKEIYPNMDGRLTIDMKMFIQNVLGTKLSTYSLNSVASYFLKSTKDDVTPQQMFSFYKKAFEEYENGDLSPSKDMAKVGRYGLYDSELVLDLFEKINTWPCLTELSNVARITIEDIFRGQQIRVMSLLSNLCFKNDIVIDSRNTATFVPKIYNNDIIESSSSSSDDDEDEIELKSDIIRFKGAHVGDPIKGLHRNVVCLDFSSLYPSIIMEENISYDTFNVKFSPVEDKFYSGEFIRNNKKFLKVSALKVPKIDDKRYIFDVEEEKINNIEFYNTLKEEDEEERKRVAFYHFQFAKSKNGLLPILVKFLIGSRKEIKNQMKDIIKTLKEKGFTYSQIEEDLNYIILNQRQLAYKIIANSTYGFTSAQKTGKLPFVELSMAITAMGRRYIKRVNKYVEEKYNGKIIYGDSVTSLTPILIKVCNNKKEFFKYIYIKDLEIYFKNHEWINSHTKEILINKSDDIISVWTYKGFTPIKSFIRHLYKGSLYTVYTRQGMVECTSDHSLLTSDFEEISPEEVNLRTSLLHYKPILNEFSINGNDVNFVVGEKVVCKNKLECAIKFFNIQLVYKNLYNIELINDKMFIVHPSYVTFNDNIKKISVKNTSKEIFVYDLSTESESFGVGPGNLIVHNTDSSMFILPHLGDDPKECYKAGHILADELSTALFPNGIVKLEFEKNMIMLIFKKKKYASLLLDKDGNYDVNKMLVRGIALARRDNCSLLRDLYFNLLKTILTFPSSEENKKLFYKCFNILFVCLLNIYKEKYNIIEYSIVNQIGKDYKQLNFKINVFVKENEKLGKPIEAGERIQFIIAKDPITNNPFDEKIKLKNIGLKMRDIRYYDNNKDTIDYYYYITHIFKNHIDQIFETIFDKTNLSIIPKKGNTKEICINTPIAFLEKRVKEHINKIKKTDKLRFNKIGINDVRLKNKEMKKIILSVYENDV